MHSSDFVEPILATIAKAERHMKSEYGTKMVGVMETIGAHPHFAMMLEPGVVKVFTGREDIAAMYGASVDYAEPQASRLLSQLATDWYMFIENVPTRLWISDGTMRTVQTVTTFIADDQNGLTGEYAWQRYYPSDEVGQPGAIPLPQRALKNLKLHADLLDATAAGDTDAFAQLLDPACLWAQRNYLSDIEGGEILRLEGSDAAAEHLARWHEQMQPQSVSILNRKVTDWFVFAEELWIVKPAGGDLRQYRVAVIYPVNAAGKFEGALGFGKDLEPASPSASTRLGLDFWPKDTGLRPVVP